MKEIFRRTEIATRIDYTLPETGTQVWDSWAYGERQRQDTIAQLVRQGATIVRQHHS